MKLSKFLFVQIFLLCSSFLPASHALADDDELPEVTIIETSDFRVDAELASQTQTPILVLFSMEGCAYCHFVEEEHLKPMLRNKDYRKKVIIRRVMTDGYDELIDFNGQKISNLDFSTRYGAYLTPTVVFLNHEGKQLSRIYGVRNTEYYGGDLDNSLNLSLQKIRKTLAAAN